MPITPAQRLLTQAINALENALEALREAEAETWLNLESAQDSTESALVATWSALDRDYQITRSGG